MQERFQKLLQRFLEFWNKYTKKQRTIFLSIVGSVIVLLVILILILGRTKYMVIAEFEDKTLAANAVSTLTENGIKTRLGSDKLTVEIDEEAEVQARILITGTFADNDLFGLENLLDNSLETTNSDRRLKNDLYIRSEIQKALESLPGIETASVIFYPTSANNSILASEDEINCSVILNLSKEISSKKAASLAESIAASLGNDTTEKIKIMDQNMNLIFGGTIDEEEEELNKKQTWTLWVTNFYEERMIELGGKNGFDTSVALSLDIDYTEKSIAYKEYLAAEGQEQGLYSTFQKISSENKGNNGDVVGTDANDETDYYIANTEGGNSSYDETKITYLPSERLTEITEEYGLIRRESSSAGIYLGKVTPVYESDLEILGVLNEEMTFEEYMANNREPRLMEREEYEYMIEIMSSASGIPVENLTVVAYESFDFIPKEVEEFNWTLVLEIGLAVVILGLLLFVVFRGLAPDEVVEMEPELSVEQLLATTKENQTLEDIELDEKSETRRLIEKLIEDNPEAVANLLRNWLNDEWG